MRSTSRPRFPFVTILVVLLIIAASIGALFYFSMAKVEITPKTVSASIQNTFSATEDTGALPYQIITVSKVASQPVPSSGTKKVTSSASGQMTIYNAQAKAQTLIATTRFATPAGLIFRIRSAVTVPGGTQAKPGSKVVTVYADKPGAAYNVGPTNFTVPGFAGTPQANLVYGRSTAAMAGGASGDTPYVEPALEKQTRAALISALTPDLMTSLEAQIPTGYVLLTGAATTTFQEQPAVPSQTSGLVDVKEQGTATAVVFPNVALAKAVASAIPGLEYQGTALSLASTTNLIFAAHTGLPGQQGTPFSFDLSGTASMIYTVDPARIAAAISGKSRPEAEVAITNYPEVKRAVIILRPFWRQTFPADPASISVSVVKEN